jgi:hypothetical protein
VEYWQVLCCLLFVYWIISIVNGLSNRRHNNGAHFLVFSMSIVVYQLGGGVVTVSGLISVLSIMLIFYASLMTVSRAVSG